MGTTATSGRNKISQIAQQLGCVIVPPEAKSAGKLRGDIEAMAERRHQEPETKTGRELLTFAHCTSRSVTDITSGICRPIAIGIDM
jgi:hypothetical protein